MATLGRRVPRIVCVRLARHFVELKVVRRLPSLSAAVSYLLDGVHVQDIALAFAK